LLGTAVTEIVKGANMAFSLCPMLTQGAAEALELHGSEEQKQLYLGKLVTGEWSGTMNLTEPQAGSDLSGVNCKAVPNGDHYLITGQKIFITYGEHDLCENIIHMVLARMPDAPPGTRGISLFIVPKFTVDSSGKLLQRNDLRCASLEHKLGIHASPTAIMSYGENDGAIGYLIGGENRGLECMFTMMNLARHAVGLEGVAIGERAYQRARDFAKERIQGRGIDGQSRERVAIIEHPDVRRMLMTMKAQVEGMRAVAIVAAEALDHAFRDPDPERRGHYQRIIDFLTPIVKGHSTDVGVEIASLGVQVHGGMGFIEETGAAQYYRDVRIASIYEGTNGIQAADLVGRKLIGDGGATARLLLDDMHSVVSALATEPDLSSIAEGLSSGCEFLATATQWVLDNAKNPRLPAAAAVPYLRLWGTVAAGWQLARSAHIAAAKLKSGAADKTFLQSKIETAGFYMTQIMPQTESLKQVIVGGSQSVLEVSDLQFAS
jgi:alkylation response protein AidB-like acyl-CoA dehydrogenase